jgi:hypothetical protein
VLPVGAAGVKLFFVLSGFLITGILLTYRDQAEAGSVTKSAAVWRFYGRRFLRIFPVYYFVLLATAAAGFPTVRETFWWHALYLTNFYIAITGDWPGYLSPFWTLAVEEQFYVMWPWVVLFAPRRMLTGICFGMILIAPLFRLAGYWTGFVPSGVGVLPVVGTTTGGSAELLHEGKTGLTFPVGDAVALADQLVRLSADPALGRVLAQAGRRLVEERFAIEKVVAETDSFLLKTIKEAPKFRTAR